MHSLWEFFHRFPKLMAGKTGMWRADIELRLATQGWTGCMQRVAFLRVGVYQGNSPQRKWIHLNYKSACRPTIPKKKAFFFSVIGLRARLLNQLGSIWDSINYSRKPQVNKMFYKEWNMPLTFWYPCKEMQLLLLRVYLWFLTLRNSCFCFLL